MRARVTVREVRHEEHLALGVLTLAAYQAVPGFEVFPAYAAELADVATRAAQGDVLVAVDDGGTLLGGITYVPGPGPLAWFDRQDHAGLRMLAVAPAAQARGVGDALVGACIERATAAGKARVLLHTTASMFAAHRLYERAGFRRDPDRDEVLEDEGGLVLLAYVLDLDR